jgi:opacity protein-like surface antigen
MKKITLIIFLIGFSVISKAQSKGSIEYGLGLGLNNATVSDNKSGNAPFKTGVNFGGSIDSYISDRWSFRTKLIYDQKGWDKGFIEYQEFSNQDYVGVNLIKIKHTVNYRMNYLTIPIMANWHFGSTRKWYLNFGPYFGILLNANIKDLDNNGKTIDFTKEFNRVDVGLALGIGYKIPISEKLKLNLEYDSQTGFSEIFKVSQDRITNSRGSFNLGLVFVK